MDEWGKAGWEIYIDLHYPERSMKRMTAESKEYEKMVEPKS